MTQQKGLAHDHVCGAGCASLFLGLRHPKYKWEWAKYEAECACAIYDSLSLPCATALHVVGLGQLDPAW